jgi:hypothetical protein
MQRPFAIWPLVFFLLFLAMGGLYGGIAMLIDPTGGSLQLTETLPLLPISSFILPGIFLLVVMGLVPLLLIYGLLVSPKWKWVERLFRWSGHHWSWTGTVGLGIALAIWLIIEGLLIGFEWAIQYITTVDGFLIMLLVLMPGVRKFYADVS